MCSRWHGGKPGLRPARQRRIGRLLGQVLLPQVDEILGEFREIVLVGHGDEFSA
ncbi:MAG: hypothetical protein P8Q36_05450 [Alphaproteobacteria bacterium]|nr:hypothetical protein [Rhodospirillaceae bacterium]MBT6510224.1 hypothetical protein [Rhodospirillaceae bacterium]MBT7613129.1 hypothetical protein [Rhodospirillaceae bacterium]MBT7647464.1 hypothetical protein [Rhodospirillaceae bacterium]MDG2480303.1 hypothetical protein [Alphaproteobacteria bacterium]